MTQPHREPWNDSWIEHLADFDEALRLGRPQEPTASVDAELHETQQFLLRLQSLWPRKPTKIGPYTLISSLGQGSIGPCYMVEEPTTLQKYVLKALWPDLSGDPQTRRHFVTEVGAVQCLRGDNIAAVREVRDDGQLCVVVIEYCQGISLAQWRLTKPQPLAWENASQVILKLADILNVAHRQELSHGNLKPTNIFLTTPNSENREENVPGKLHEATPRIADFALAKAVQQTRVTAQGGLPWPMPQYLAPEQLQHRVKPAGPACDIYALGVLWYDLLTGRCPVRGITRNEILDHTRSSIPAPPRQYRPEIPVDVEALVLRCLRKDPRERPATARQLIDALQAFLPKPTPSKPAWWRRWLKLG